MLYVLPLEPLEERYTKQWYEWFLNKLRYLHVPFEYIVGESLTDRVKTGKVLDASGTIYYKMKQIEKLSVMFSNGYIKSGDKFFLFDGQFPGVESIRYMAELYNVDVEVYCYFHASSYTRGDFTEPMKPWLRRFELAWFNYYDKVFVASDYHKQAILDRCFKKYSNKYRKQISKKIEVVGMIFNDVRSGFMRADERIYDVIWSNRFDSEKNPEVLLRLASDLPHVKFILTSGRDYITNDPYCLSLARLVRAMPNITIKLSLKKNEYYSLLSASKVYITSSLEENFGICLLEALAFGCYPLVPNCCAHVEIVGYDEKYIYRDYDNLKSKLLNVLSKRKIKSPKSTLYTYHYGTIERILRGMRVI